jgi:hypothetical protein
MAGLEISFPSIDVVQVDGIRTSEVWAIASSPRCDDELNSNGWEQYDL